MQSPSRRLRWTVIWLLAITPFDAHTTADGAFNRENIPKIIHQSWKVETLPVKLRRWQQTMK